MRVEPVKGHMTNRLLKSPLMITSIFSKDSQFMKVNSYHVDFCRKWIWGLD